ncbi:MAG: class I SAM-dependent methyltransferase [Betaproteobacteria bacterium]|nr:class I SAM-dependent methyltransferase [Betaproteobacteria bacterium]
MSYSRAQPSPRYVELQQLYRTMHEKGEDFLGVPPEKTFSGESLLPQCAHIKRLIERTGAQTILDYGSGKGRQYEPHLIKDGSGRRWPSVMDYWNVEEVVCYDPCYPPLSRLPEGKFDGVICTDVLEHCPEEDIPWIVEEIFGYAGRFVFANVACYPARKRLPSGENAHCTIRPVEWWSRLLEEIATRHAGMLWEVRVHTRDDLPGGPQYVERVIGNA